MDRSFEALSRGPQGTRGLRGTLDQQHSRHQGLARKMIGKKGQIGIKPLAASSSSRGIVRLKSIDKGKPFAMRRQRIHGSVILANESLKILFEIILNRFGRFFQLGA
jgi:hypothetical protein